MKYASEYMKTKEAALYLNFRYKTLEAWRGAGVGPEYLRLENGHIRYKRSALDDWMHREAPVAAA